MQEPIKPLPGQTTIYDYLEGDNMAITLEDVGLIAYINEKYKSKGGYARFVRLVDEYGWPRGQIAKEFGISRPWLNKLITKYEEEQKQK